MKDMTKCCACERLDCHPNGDCRKTESLTRIEIFGYPQSLCSACLARVPANLIDKKG